MNKGAYYQGFEDGKKGKDSKYPYVDDWEYKDELWPMGLYKRRDFLESYRQGYKDGKKK